MNTNQNTKRILIFLALAFGIPWIAALVISRSRLMIEHPAQAVGTANLIFISFPWLANIATRIITREGWGNLWLRPNFRRGWRFYLALWLLPLLATLVGGLVFYLFFPQSFDPNFAALRETLEEGSHLLTAGPWALFGTVMLSLMLISVPGNTLISLGEEFGWRAYLLQKIMIRFNKPAYAGGDPAGAVRPPAMGGFQAPGARRAALLTGILHGVWHLPLILMTIGLTPGVTIFTPLVYLLFTCALSILLSWGTLNSGSVWPAALGHGAVNATSILPGFFLAGAPIALLGPDPTGLIGGVGYTILALVLFFRKRTTDSSVATQGDPAMNWQDPGLAKR